MVIPSEAELRALYVNDRLSTRQLGQRYGVAHITIRRWLERHGIPVRPSGSGLANRGRPVPTAAELQRFIYDERLTYAQVGERYGVDKSAVAYWLDRFGISRPPRSHIVPAQVCDLYEAGASAEVIAQDLGCCKTTVLNILGRMEIARRPEGWRMHITAADGTLVRSTYEVRVADWLHAHGITYEYEPRVPFGHGNMRADFRANEWYIEVWGVQKVPEYHERRRRKIGLYRAASLPLIELSPHHFGARDRHIFERRMSLCLQAP